MKDILLKYVRYNFWANFKVCNSIENITDEQYEMNFTSSFPSLKKTLLHIHDAEIIWLSRLNGNSPSHLPSADFSGSKNEIINFIPQRSQELIDYVKFANEDILRQNIKYNNLAGEMFEASPSYILLHCVNHSTFHRGQLITIMRNVGVTDLPKTDLIDYQRSLE